MWYKQFGWNDNPFVLIPTHRIVGLHDERKLLMDAISAKQISFLTGETGYGKTSMLLWLHRTLNRTNKNITPVMVNGVRIDSKQQFIDTLKKHRKITDKFFFREYPKNMIILMDEAQHFPTDVLELARVMWDDGIAHTIILASIEAFPSNVSSHFKDRISKVVRVPSLKRGDLVEMLKSRMSDSNPFDLDALISIIDLSGGIPRRVLERSAEICMWAAENDIHSISGKVVQDWVKKAEPKAITKEEQKTEQKITMITERTTEQKEQAPLVSVEKVSLSYMQQKIYQSISNGINTIPVLSKTLGIKPDIIRIQLKRMSDKGAVKYMVNTRPRRYALAEERFVLASPATPPQQPVSGDIEGVMIDVLKKRAATSGKSAIDKSLLFQDVQNRITAPLPTIENMLSQLITQGKVASINEKVFVVELKQTEQTIP